MASLSNKDDVNVLVGEVFSDFVKSEDKNVVVMFTFGAC